MADRTVKVKLIADTSQYSSGMAAAAKATDSLGKQASKAEQDAGKAAAEHAKRMESYGAKMKKWSTAAGIGVAAGLAYSIKAASDQEQAMGSLQAVFKSSFGTMEQYSQQSTEIGLSQAEYAQSASVLGAQLRNLGVDQSALAGNTNELMGFASDMANQFNTSVPEAIDAVSAALRGERDPIERYGVTLNEANIKAEMAAEGFTKTEATLSLLKKQLADTGTIGATAREMDTAAGAAKKMQAELKDAAAELGQALLPAFTTAAQGASGLLAAFNALPAPIQAAVTALSAVGAGALLVGPRIASTVQAIRDLQTWLNNGSVAAGRFSTAMKAIAVGAGITAGVAGLVAMRDALQGLEFGQASQDLDLWQQQIIRFAQSDGSAELGRFGGEVRSIGEEFAAQGPLIAQFFTQQSDGISGWTGQVRAGAEEIDALDKNLASLVKAGYAEEAARAVELIKQQTEAAGGDADAVAEILDDYSAAAEAAATATENSAAASQEDAAAKQQQSAAVKALINDLNQLMQLNLAIMGSENALAGQRERMNAAIKENGQSLSMATAAGRANRDAMLSELGTITQVVEATRKKNEAQGMESAQAASVASAQTARLTADFMANAQAAGFNKQQLAGMVAQALDIPKDVAMKIAAKGADMTKKQLTELIRNSLKLDGVDPSVDTSTNAFATTRKVQGTVNAAKTLDKQSPNVGTDTNAPGTTKKIEGSTNAAKTLDKQSPNVDTDTNAPTTQGLINSLKMASEDADSVDPNVSVSTNAGGVTQSMWSLTSAINSIPTQKTITINTVRTGGGGGGGGGGSWATGGLIIGPGTGTSDSIPAMVSNGEYVQRAKAVAKYGIGFMEALNRGLVDPRLLPSFADGGRVSGYSKKAWRKLSPQKQRELQTEQAMLAALNGRAWADQRWRDYNPIPDVKRAPSRRKGEKTKAWNNRLAEWDKERRSTSRDWGETIAREDLDLKWRKIDDAAEAQKQAAEDAARKQEEATQEFWDGVQTAIDEAQARKDEAIQKAQQAYDDLVSARDAFASQVADNVKSAGNVSNVFNWGGEDQALQAHTQAVESTKDAEQRLLDARRAANEADPRSRADALRAVAAAQRDLVAAQKAETAALKAAQAAKATPANVVKGYLDQLKAAQRYTSQIQTLSKRGLSQDILRELASLPPDQAAEQLAAFMGMSSSQIRTVNNARAGINLAGNQLGSYLGNQFYGSQITAALNNLRNAQNAPLNFGAQSINMSLDSQQVWSAVLEMQRRSGNTYQLQVIR